MRKPRPTGLYGTIPTPSSRAAGTISASMPRVHSDHSLCSAAIGCTAQAARSVSALTSLRPMKRTLPSSTSSAIPPTISSIGTSGLRRCM